MAARLNKLHQASVREKIRGGQLINNLQKHADGKLDLSATQVSAAKILLDKIIPNLKSIELTGDPDNPVITKVVVEVVDTTD